MKALKMTSSGIPVALSTLSPGQTFYFDGQSPDGPLFILPTNGNFIAPPTGGPIVAWDLSNDHLVALQPTYQVVLVPLKVSPA